MCVYTFGAEYLSKDGVNCSFEERNEGDLFEELVVSMSHEQHLLHPSAAALATQYRNGLSEIIVDNGQIVAHATLWPLCDGFYEMGTVWVRLGHREHGHAHHVMKHLLSRYDHIMLTSTNPVVWRIAEEIGMRVASFDELPDAVQIATCSCTLQKRGGGTGHADCPRRDRDCRMCRK